jgi:hypothetical protein
VKVKYVTAVNNLKIPGDLGRGDKLDATTFITNNHLIIQKLVDRVVISIMGTLEWSAICESNTVIYATDEIAEAHDPVQFLNRRLFQTQGFLHALWLVLDNAADNDLGFLLYNAGGMPRVSSNFIARGISKADGTTGSRKLRVTSFAQPVFCYINVTSVILLQTISPGWKRPLIGLDVHSIMSKARVIPKT